MGSETTYPIKIFCFGNKDDVLQKIFPEKDIQDQDQWERRIYKRTTSFTENETEKTISKTIVWKAKLYPDIIDGNDGNINKLFNDLIKRMDIPKDGYNEKEKDQNDPKAREKIKNIIIKFGKENSEYIINYLDSIEKLYLPQIAIITNENFDEKEEGLKDNRYITIIRYKNTEEIQKKLFEYLWEKECYYNERGTIILNTPDKIETNNYINIMLTGISRSGKSTLINVLSEKLVTLESPFLESVTNEIREYKVITSENGEFLTGLRFFDTPGLTVTKKRNTIKEVQNAIEKKINETKDSRDDIHLIYFMQKNLDNLEAYVDFFKFIIKKNKERVKEGKKKIYMIFIFNQSNESSEASLIQFLKDNDLYNDLIEIYDESNKENKTIDFNSFKFKNKIKKKDNKKPKYNIVRLNLLKDEEEGKKVFGIDNLLKLTLNFIRKDNPFKGNYFDKLKQYEIRLNDSNLIEEEKKQIENDIKQIYKDISEQNSFFSNVQSFDSIIANAHFHNRMFKIKYKLFDVLLIWYFWRKPEISEYIHIFKKIEQNYKIYTDEIMLKPIMNDEDVKTFEKFDIVKISDETDKSKKEINDNINLLEKSENKIKVCLNIKGKLYEDIVPFPTVFELYSFYELLVDYFDEYIKETCCINSVLKQKEIYDNIFKQLENMSNKNVWGEFHPTIK